MTAAGTARLKPDYLRRRHETEAWLLAQRREKLGAPRLEHPIYFFLGDMTDGRDSSRPLSICMPLAAFSDDMLTFTYPDSMASLPIATQAKNRHLRRSYHGQVFTMGEVQDLVRRFGMPRRDDFVAFGHADRFIEVQVWDERPLRPFLHRLAAAHRSPVG